MADDSVAIDIKIKPNHKLALLQAGSMVTIDISTPAGQKGKFRTAFVGFSAKQYVLIQFPEAKKLGNFAQYIKQGLVVTVRGLIEGKEGAVVAFVGTIKQIILIPSKLMVLDFPRTVTLQNLRSSIRIETAIVAKAKIEGTFWLTTITDLSIDGCHLDIDNGEKLALSENKPILILVEEYKGIQGIKLIGNVCNIKNQSTGLSFGVKFNDKSLQDVTRLLYHAVSV